MTWHVYPTIGRRDNFRPPNIRDKDREVRIPIESSGVPNEISTHKVWEILDLHHLNTNDVAVELYRLAVGVYSSDIRISRNGNAFDSWTRDIALYIPVTDIDLWDAVKDTLQEFLSFLTGDHWTIYMRQHKTSRPLKNMRAWKKGGAINGSTVSLFSGGLDSFIGAVDAISKEESVTLVGHYDESITKGYQRDIFKGFSSEFSPDQLRFLQFYISAPAALTGQKESTKRSRSFLFLTLGTLVASALGEDGKLMVPENGFISLNVPLTGTRLGSLSTRTTHPYTMHLFKKILAGLGIKMMLDTPYRFLTKGEMIAQVKDLPIVQNYSRQTFSCAHLGQGRWDGVDPRKPCGYCLPCLIRRASLYRNGLDVPKDYRFDALKFLPKGKRSSDFQAIRIGLAHKKQRSAASSVLQAGPLPATSEEISQYIRVYERGVNEIETFLNQK